MEKTLQETLRSSEAQEIVSIYLDGEGHVMIGTDLEEDQLVELLISILTVFHREDGSVETLR